MSGTYYNDNDPYCAQWLRNLIAAGLIAPGDVDERSIKEVKPDDLRGYTQCHFFAGIGGWSYALRLAGWPDEQPVWTGSCPCQPLSSAGQRKGHADERHLWPAFHSLIAECAPAIVFGEQVASKDGREWLAALRIDLEALGYACGAADLPACGVGAPHVRQRLWFVADAHGQCKYGLPINAKVAPVSESLADADFDPGHEGWPYNPAQEPGRRWSVEPAVGRVAHGIPARVGKLRAFGNAIVPAVAAEFIGAYLECCS